MAVCALGCICSYADLYSHPTRTGRFCALGQKGLTAEKRQTQPGGLRFRTVDRVRQQAIGVLLPDSEAVPYLECVWMV